MQNRTDATLRTTSALTRTPTIISFHTACKFIHETNHESPEEEWGSRFVIPSTVEADTPDSQAVPIRPNNADVDSINQTPTEAAAARTVR